MFSLFSRFDSGRFCEWYECTGCTRALGAQDHHAVRTWLSGFLVDDVQALRLRDVARLGGTVFGLERLSNQQVVDCVAALVASDRLRVCGRQEVYRQDVKTVGIIAARPGLASPSAPLSRTWQAPAAPLPSAPVARQRSGPLAPPLPAPTTLPGNVDAVAMAASLIAAAADGVPFCAICERMKSEREQAERAIA